MEEKVQQKVIAIMEFLSNYDGNISMQSMFSAQSFYHLIIALKQPLFDFTCRIHQQPSTWLLRLDNFEMIIMKIERYFQQIHHKCLSTSKLNLIELSKNQSVTELITFFQIVMCLVMESTKKQTHIQHIMELRESFQEHFVGIIQNAINANNFSPGIHRNQNYLHDVLLETSEQYEEMEKEIMQLSQVNAEITYLLSEQKKINEKLREEINEKSLIVSQNQNHQANVRYLEDYVEKLKARIVQNLKQFQDEKVRFTFKIKDLEDRVSKEQQSEQLSSIYKEKYQEIMDQMQKMNIWPKQKAKLQKSMQEKNFAIKKLYEKLEELSDLNLALQQKQLQLNFEMEKKSRKIKKLSEDLKRAIGYNNEGFSNLLDHSISYRDNISFVEEEDQINKLKKNNEKFQKENKQHQKEILRLQKKCQKYRILEEEKKRLELLVYQLRSTQSQQINLLTAVFYEGYKDSMEMTKNSKLSSFNHQRKKRVRTLLNEELKEITNQNLILSEEGN